MRVKPASTVQFGLRIGQVPGQSVVPEVIGPVFRVLPGFTIPTTRICQSGHNAGLFSESQLPRPASSAGFPAGSFGIHHKTARIGSSTVFMRVKPASTVQFGLRIGQVPGQFCCSRGYRSRFQGTPGLHYTHNPDIPIRAQCEGIFRKSATPTGQSSGFSGRFFWDSS